MMKKWMAILLVLALGISLCACAQGSEDEDETKETVYETLEKGPEQVAKEFIGAMYRGDLDTFCTYIPEFAYDVILEAEGGEVPEGKSKADAVRDVFARNMEEEPEELASEVKVETKISDTMDRQTYKESVWSYYVGEGIVSEDMWEQVEDAVFVAFNCDVTFENGETFSMEDFEAEIPCVKIDGRWYADILYLVYVPVQAAPEVEEVPAY